MSRREDQKQKTRSRILRVSLELFREKGFQQTTMREIAQGSGIALGTTYNYFPTKEHIALEFFERALSRLFSRYEREVPAGASLEERLFLLLTLHIDELEPYEEFLTMLVVQAAAPTSRLHPSSMDSRKLRNRYLDFVAEILEKARQRGEFPDLGYDDLLLQGFWVYQLGILTFWLNDESPGKEDTVVFLDRSLTFILDALRQGGRLAP